MVQKKPALSTRQDNHHHHVSPYLSIFWFVINILVDPLENVCLDITETQRLDIEAVGTQLIPEVGKLAGALVRLER